MRLAPDLQRRFEPCLQIALENSRTLRKRLTADRSARAARDPENSILRGQCEDSIDGLLSIIQRKTTPFYVRLIHGAVHFYLGLGTEEGAETLLEAAQVIDSVASTVGREAYRIPEVWKD